MVLSTYPRIWLGVFDYFVGSGLKGNICVYACMFPCMLCFVMFCMFCMYISYMSIHMCFSLCMCCTHFCLYKSYLVICLSSRYLGCYFSVWHCYLGSILAFSFKIVKLDTTNGTTSSTQVIKTNIGNMNSLFPTLIINNCDCMYLFIPINSDLSIDWLIDA